MIKGVHHIAILCSDRQAALAFYEGALGFSVERTHVRPEREDEILMLCGYGVMLELFVSKNHPPRVTGPEAYWLRHLAFCVTELEAFVERLQSQGYCPEPIRCDSFTGERMTFVKDPDGLPIELHE